MKRILIIDDEESISDLLKLVLELDGYVPTIATSAQDAFVKLTEGQFDALILDILMPGFNGFTVLSFTADWKPIIVVSAIGDREEVKHRCMALGARAVIAKPFDNDELLGTLRRVIEEDQETQ